ncbi:MAG TPA: glycosyltransferase family 4 protein [Gaiellaceae bacterium]|nr:glycosyltransferase family 4 protein [Gaiellaceae bacterium]
MEATAHLLTELCEALAEEYEVEVVTGVLHGLEDLPREEEHNGVRVVRVFSTSYERSELHRRASNYFSYLGSALAYVLGRPAPDLVLCMTDPPIVGDLGVVVGRRFRVPVLVISQDVFPEIATQLDRLRNPAVVGVLGVLVGAYLRRADRIVAIGETMRRRLEEKGAPPERLRVIPNWVDTRAITPQPRDNEWARQHGLDGVFVAMHSGNVGHAQDLDSLVRAATFLRDRGDVRIVIAGFGARHAEMVELAKRLEVEDTVRFLPYQKRERLPFSLSSADVHVVGLARGLAGYVVPSRLYGVLAAGRPVIAAADEESETARLVREVGCGLVLPPGRPELLARTLREAADGAYDLVEMGRRGRAYVEREADRVVAMERYRALVRELLAERP